MVAVCSKKATLERGRLFSFSSTEFDILGDIQAKTSRKTQMLGFEYQNSQIL